MNNAVVFRPKSNLVWGGVALTLDALFLLQVIFYPQAGDNVLAQVGVALLVAAGVVLLWFKPKLVLEATHVVVVNPMSRTKIAYTDIDALETKWALRILHSGGATRVWVAPTNGKQRWVTDTTQRWTFRRLNGSQQVSQIAEPASASLNSDSGIAAELIRQRIAKLH